MKKFIFIMTILCFLTATVTAQSTEEVLNYLDGKAQQYNTVAHVGKGLVYGGTTIGLVAFGWGTYWNTREEIKHRDYDTQMNTAYIVGACSVITAITGLMMWSIASKKHEKALKHLQNYINITDYVPRERQKWEDEED